VCVDNEDSLVSKKSPPFMCATDVLLSPAAAVTIFACKSMKYVSVHVTNKKQTGNHIIFSHSPRHEFVRILKAVDTNVSTTLLLRDPSLYLRHGMSLCGCACANALTGPATRRSLLPSRSTGFTALPSTLAYVAFAAFSASVFGSCS
jgi:hypothetical protein